MGVGMPQQRLLPMVASWLCPGSRKPEVQVKPSKSMTSKELERVGIHLLTFPSLLRFTQGLSCYPAGACFMPGTAVVCRMQMHGFSTQRRAAGRNQPQPMSTAATAHQFSFLFSRRAMFHA